MVGTDNVVLLTYSNSKGPESDEITGNKRGMTSFEEFHTFADKFTKIQNNLSVVVGHYCKNTTVVKGAHYR